jgi:hypothetical protein
VFAHISVLDVSQVGGAPVSFALDLSPQCAPESCSASSQHRGTAFQPPDAAHDLSQRMTPGHNPSHASALAGSDFPLGLVEDLDNFHYSPESSVSIGSGPEAYNRNLTARMIQAKFDAMKSEMNQMIDEMSCLKMAQVEARQPALKESEERGGMADPERASDLEKKLATVKNKIRILERQKDALRKAIERQRQTLARMDNAGLAAGRAQPVKNSIPVLPGL